MSDETGRCPRCTCPAHAVGEYCISQVASWVREEYNGTTGEPLPKEVDWSRCLCTAEALESSANLLLCMGPRAAEVVGAMPHGGASVLMYPEGRLWIDGAMAETDRMIELSRSGRVIAVTCQEMVLHRLRRRYAEHSIPEGHAEVWWCPASGPVAPVEFDDVKPPGWPQLFLVEPWGEEIAIGYAKRRDRIAAAANAKGDDGDE